MAKKSNNPIVAKVNQNFLIKYRTPDDNRFKLVSAGKYETIVGEEFKNRHFKAIFEGKAASYTFKIRNRLEIVFLAK